MRVKELFKNVSDHLRIKFQMSSLVKHNTVKGDIREGALSTFLNNNMLPNKFSIGSGEIVSSKSHTARQSDLIIYDSHNSVPLYYEDEGQVYPIEIVCGIIEVKSALSKEKLIEGLINIKSVRDLNKGLGPFGIVFGYKLSSNSIDSLFNNIQDWESKNDFNTWPDLVVVNGEGLIFHTNDGFSFSRPTSSSKLTYRSLNKETFFSFYSILLQLLQEFKPKTFSILDYYYAPSQVGEYAVYNHDNIVNDGKVYKLKQEFIDTIFKNLKKPTTQEEFRDIFAFQHLFSLAGVLSDRELLIYNPNNTIIQFQKEWLSDPNSFTDELNYIIINDYFIVYPTSIIKDSDTELIPDKKPEDL